MESRNEGEPACARCVGAVVAGIGGASKRSEEGGTEG